MSMRFLTTLFILLLLKEVLQYFIFVIQVNPIFILQYRHKIIQLEYFNKGKILTPREILFKVSDK